jgi:hypothetical protein
MNTTPVTRLAQVPEGMTGKDALPALDCGPTKGSCVEMAVAA